MSIRASVAVLGPHVVYTFLKRDEDRVFFITFHEEMCAKVQRFNHSGEAEEVLQI